MSGGFWFTSLTFFIKTLETMLSLSKIAVKNLTEEQYHDMNAYSYSIIRKYATGGFKTLKTLFDKVTPTPEMKFGTLVDCMVTAGMGEAARQYDIMDVVPTDAKKSVLDYLLSKENVVNMNNCKLEDVQDMLITAADELGYQKRWGVDAKLKSFLGDAACTEYFSKMKSGKTIVSAEDWTDAMAMTKALHNHPYLKDIFGEGNKDGIEYLYQAKFIADILINDDQIIHVKIMPDLLVVNHNKKYIIPVDLKTSSMPAYDFADHWQKMRYDLQASMYTEVLNLNLLDSEEFADYKIGKYLFVDISREDKIPVSFIYDPRDADQLTGLCIPKGDSQLKYRGWKQLLSEIVYYLDNNAVVPNYIDPIEPNDIINLLAR